MSSSFGRRITVSTFGASHGTAIGAVVDGLPCGFRVDIDRLHRFLARRAPGNNAFGTQRKETDTPYFLSGIEGDELSGSPLAFYIQNKDHHSSDYNNLRDIPRPSHADLTAIYRYGPRVDMRGGGHFSGRLTAPLCVAGGIALQILEQRGIRVAAHLSQVGTIRDAAINAVQPDMDALAAVAAEPIPMLEEGAREFIEQHLTALREQLDSTGGVVEVVATGMPEGVGNPNFDTVESRLAQVTFGVPGVKGVEFGCGFAGCAQTGSAVNDPFAMRGGKIVTTTNHSGGIQGGITNGQPIIMRVGMKPTASIAQPQRSVSVSAKEETDLVIKGRHDPCIAIRAVPVMEAVMALVLLDFLVEVDPSLRFEGEVSL